MVKNATPKAARSSPRAALTRAIALLGGPTAAARAVGVRSQQVVQGWLSYRGLCPAKHVVALERATDGVVTREMLRPDLYGGR